MLSIPHMIVIFVVVLVVFGPQKLPELARGLGKLMAEFRKASLDFRSAFDNEMRDLERQARDAEWRKSQAAAATAAGQPAQAESGVAAAPEPLLTEATDSSTETVARASDPSSPGAPEPAATPETSQAAVEADRGRS